VKESGTLNKFTAALQPLEKYKKDISLISGLTHYNHKAVHSSCETFLTGADIKRTPGRAFHNDISVDQVLAGHLGKNSRFASLPLSDNKVDGCGKGASLSWDQVGNPVMGIQDPLTLYNSMFGGGLIPLEKRKSLLADRRSVLDAVLHEASSLNKKVTRQDKAKIDEYFTSIRSLEKRLAKEVEWVDTPPPKVNLKQPQSRMSGMVKYRSMIDMIVTGFKTNLTNVSTYRIGTDELLAECNKELGYRMGGHVMSHYNLSGGPELKVSRLRDRKHSELLAYLIGQLKSVKEIDGSTLFDNTVIVMGSGVNTHHTLRNLPIVVAGHGAGLKQGQHIVTDGGRLSNLYLTILKAAGVPVESFSDSDGTIASLV
jgi:hypothetical protein